MNKGNRLWIISEEISINRLTKPSTQTLGGRRLKVSVANDGMTDVVPRFDNGTGHMTMPGRHQAAQGKDNSDPTLDHQPNPA